MSSLRPQSPLEYPQMHSPSFPLCPVQGTVSRKKKQKSAVLLCPNRVFPKRGCMAAEPEFKSQHQSSSAAQFLTPRTISYACQHSPILPALLGCHSKSGQAWLHGVEPIFSKLSRRPCNQGELLPSYIPD